MKTYMFVFFGSLLLSLGLTPIVIYLARCLNIYDDPQARKVHATAVPRIGGVAIFLAMLALIIPVLLISNTIGETFRSIQTQVIALLGAGAFIFLVGLADDLCNLRARTRLLAQLFAAGTLCALGIRIDSVAVGDWFTLEFGWLAWPLTILWIAGITNAVNFIDGLDGLAAGIAAIACGVIAILALYAGNVVTAVFMLALLGSLTGFLAFNFNPARVFMGDSGSMFIGFMIGASSVMNAHKSATLVALALPFLALGVPIFDTAFSMLRRLLERRSMFSADRSHIHHRLTDMGLNQRHVVLFIYVVTLLVAGLGMFMMITHDGRTMVVLFCVTLLLLLVFRLVGAVRLRESIARMKQNLQITYHRRHHQSDFDQAVMLMRNAQTFDDWWQGLCVAGAELELAWISLRLQDRAGTDRTMVWRNEKVNPNPEDLIDITLPLRQRRSGQKLRLEFASIAHGSLELSSHHAGLFTRLVEEYSLISLPPAEPATRRTRIKTVPDRIKPSLKVQPHPGAGGS
jgi:UDP-GlcNAc:undecaprenyl-phosphate GlcNAc-1-phosphate transferase